MNHEYIMSTSYTIVWHWIVFTFTWRQLTLIGDVDFTMPIEIFVIGYHELIIKSKIFRYVMGDFTPVIESECLLYFLRVVIMKFTFSVSRETDSFSVSKKSIIECKKQTLPDVFIATRWLLIQRDTHNQII